MLNPAYTREEVERQLADSGARLVFTVPELLSMIAGVPPGGRLEDAIVLGEESWESLLRSTSPAPAPAIDPREDVVALPYSAGTTGLPKGVMLTHRNLVANLVQLDAAGHMGEDETLLAFLPFFHIYGLTVILSLGLRKGATIVTMPRFDLEAYLAAVGRFRATLAHLVPPIVLQIARREDLGRFDLSSLRMAFSGAAPLSAELTRAFCERAGCPLRQGYGMTEASPATHMSPRDPCTIQPGSAGVLLPSTEARIVDPGIGGDLGIGRDLGPGERGEILVRGPQVMKGYRNAPEATAATVDAQGWLHTGDIGCADADGHFWITDRAKELIKYKGLPIAPAELEAILLEHPAVLDAAVIGVRDESAGEAPKAFVVLRHPASVEEILAFLAARVTSYKRARSLAFLERIPRSSSGKILRRVLAARERAGIPPTKGDDP